MPLFFALFLLVTPSFLFASSQPKPIQISPMIQLFQKYPHAKIALDSFLCKNKKDPSLYRFLFTSSLTSESIVNAEKHGEISTGWMSLQDLQTLVLQKKIQAVAFSRKLKPTLDLSQDFLSINQVRIKQKWDGKGVLIGIIDTGIDVSHPAFWDAKKQTRVVGILDYSILENDQPSFWSQKEIQQVLNNKEWDSFLHQDFSGHGTHIAGIALGNGMWENDVQTSFVGMAPKSSLFVVKAQRENSNEFQSADVLDAIKRVHTFAKLHQLPYVINLSLGGHLGGHDGSELLEKGLEEYAGQGKKGQIIVASAGNERKSAIHARVWFREGNQISLPLQIPAKTTQGLLTGALQVSLWFSKGDTCRLQIFSPLKNKLLHIDFSQEKSGTSQSKEGILFYQILQEKNGGISVHLFWGSSINSPLASGKWKIVLEGHSSRMDAWIAESTLNTSYPFFMDHVVQELLVGTPGSSKAVITVGSVDNRSGWVTFSGQEITDSLNHKGQISPFSSMGPTRDLRIKPDVVAPGNNVVSAISRHSSGKNENSLVQKGYAIGSGTSQSAPHISGSIALLLQKDPQLDVEEVRALLQQNSYYIQEPSFSFFSGLSNPSLLADWGSGIPHVYRLLEQIGNTTSPASSISEEKSHLFCSLCSIPANPSSKTKVFLVLKDTNDRVVLSKQKVLFEASTGQLVAPVAFAAGLYSTELWASSQKGISIVTVRVNDRLWQKQKEILYEAEPFSQREAKGCSCEEKQTSFSVWILFLFFLVWQRIQKVFFSA